jgi:hypothetical protein
VAEAQDLVVTENGAAAVPSGQVVAPVQTVLTMEVSPKPVAPWKSAPVRSDCPKIAPSKSASEKFASTRVELLKSVSPMMSAPAKLTPLRSKPVKSAPSICTPAAPIRHLRRAT